ncbi:hypothetical protein HBA92_00160 [Ochrobactrum sp. MR28]|nr:hypothetical protein [Ochrobactrum sp. MR28]MBX8816934.1 hypothetical protein [Ochrobactrum sp. MR31]
MLLWPNKGKKLRFYDGFFKHFKNEPDYWLYAFLLVCCAAHYALISDGMLFSSDEQVRQTRSEDHPPVLCHEHNAGSVCRVPQVSSGFNGHFFRAERDISAQFQCLRHGAVSASDDWTSFFILPTP